MTQLIRRIRSATLEQLRDVNFLTNLICQAGFDFGGIESLDAPGLWRGGMKLKQLPCQLAPYLAFLSWQNISSYIEIGVASGGTFVITCEYLKRFKVLVDAVAVDIEKPTPLLDEYLWENSAVRFLRCDTQSKQFPMRLAGSTFDYCLIDGSHREQDVMNDYETTKPLSRLIGLHDIEDQANQPGVVNVWNSIPKERWQDFTAQYELKEGCELPLPIMGLGLIGLRESKEL